MKRQVFEYFFKAEELGPEIMDFVDWDATVPQEERVQARQPSPAVSTDLPSQEINPPPLIAATQQLPVATEKPIVPGGTRVRRLLSVHALGQFAFCERAGILANESDDVRDPDEPLPRLTYLPNFDLAKIEEALAASYWNALLGLLYLASLAIFIFLGIAQQQPLLAGILLLLFSAVLVWECSVLVQIVRLVRRRLTALNANAECPLPDVHVTQPINWWSMLKAGFEPVTYQRPFRHPELPLEGTPWRVLERDSLRIPVIHAAGKRIGPGKNEPFQKYRIRLAAYALLLEAAGHVQAPYGLVFPPDNPNGLVVPLRQHIHQQLRGMIDKFSMAAQASRENLHPSLPENRNKCQRCSFGKPVRISTVEIENRRKSGDALVVLRDPRGQAFECMCSSQFGSVPPHQEIRDRQLMAGVE